MGAGVVGVHWRLCVTKGMVVSYHMTHGMFKGMVNLVLQHRLKTSRLERASWALLNVFSVVQAAVYHKVIALGQISGLFHLSALPETEDSCHSTYLMNAPEVLSAATRSHEFLYLLLSLLCAK